METYIHLTEDYIFNNNKAIGYPLRLAKGTYLHMRDNEIMNSWNKNCVSTKVRRLATDMTMYEYMQHMQARE